MITISVDKQDLVAMCKGTTPSYKQMEDERVKANGSYTGGHGERWDWNWSAFKDYTEQELYELYLFLKNK